MLNLTLFTDSYVDAILSLLYEEDTNYQVNTILATAWEASIFMLVSKRDGKITTISFTVKSKKSVSESKLKFGNRQNQLLDMLNLTLLTDSYGDAILSLL